MPSRRLTTPLLLALALALAAVLTILAPSVQLAEGTPFAFAMRQMQTGAAPNLGGGDFIVALLRALLALAILAVPIYIVLSLLTKDGRQRLISHAIAVALLILLLQGIQRLNPTRPDATQQVGNAMPEAPVASGTPVPEAVFDQTVSEDAVTTATIIVALLLALTALGITAAMLRRKPPPPSPLDDLAGDAQQAIDALHAGDALEETIQRCYRNMCDVLQRERQIQRAAAVTPHEFEESLVQAGLPRAAVHTLTNLFERIRYGNQPAGDAEQAEAIESLSAIVAACAAGTRRRA